MPRSALQFLCRVPDYAELRGVKGDLPAANACLAQTVGLDYSA